VAVRAHEFALLQLVEHECTALTSDHAANAIQLFVAREMVPVHDPRWENLAAVCARHRLQRIHPCPRCVSMRAFALSTRGSSPLHVIATVIRPATVAAIRVLSRSGVVILGLGLPESTHRATSHHAAVRSRGRQSYCHAGSLTLPHPARSNVRIAWQFAQTSSHFAISFRISWRDRPRKSVLMFPSFRFPGR